MPGRLSEVSDIGFSLSGLTSDLQDVTKQQQKIILDKGPVCSAAVQQVCSRAVHHWWCFIIPMGNDKVLLETGSENPAWVGSGLADTPLLGVQSNLKALVLMVLMNLG
ncbi:hypothetical protein BTVI_18562 [Pitangus sulphuratus]|nr:hypothetical protein BTVI_18562 [Pitangus sulphuratus]